MPCLVNRSLTLPLGFVQSDWPGLGVPCLVCIMLTWTQRWNLTRPMMTSHSTIMERLNWISFVPWAIRIPLERTISLRSRSSTNCRHSRIFQEEVKVLTIVDPGQSYTKWNHCRVIQHQCWNSHCWSWDLGLCCKLHGPIGWLIRQVNLCLTHVPCGLDISILCLLPICDHVGPRDLGIRGQLWYQWGLFRPICAETATTDKR